MEKPKNLKSLKNSTSSKDNVVEPLIEYSAKSKKITISTLAEQEQDNYLFWLSLTPAERIAHVTVLIRNIYADQLSLPSKTKRIIFDTL